MNDSSEPSERSDTSVKHRIRSFVVRAGRMTAGQERALRDLWPVYGIESETRHIEPAALFGRDGRCVLEIGFGTGDALVSYAKLNPDANCIGIEVHRPGVGHLMLRAEQLQLKNIRVVCRDAVEVLTESLSAACLDEIHIFFPDPWHKKRHHKRRLIQHEFADILARALKPNGLLLLATDWQDYAEQMLSVFTSHTAFANLSTDTSQTHPGFSPRPEHRPVTRFERRGHRLGYGVWDLRFKRT